MFYRLFLIAASVFILPALSAQTGQWQTINSSNTPTARHECSYVAVGTKFYLVGGRLSKPTQVYDPAANSWTTEATPPIQLHHFQAIEYNGKIYAVCAFSGNCCHETGVENIYIYDPAAKAWSIGPAIPAARRRGAAGCVVYNNKFYVVCGATDGHSSGWVSWLDRYDPQTNTWTQLADAPRTRDHLVATVANGKIYAIGGRRSGFNGNIFKYTVPEIDVYDIASNTWSTLPASLNIPTQRSAPSVAVLGDEILVIGGEGASVAYATTEAFNYLTQTWRTLAPMNQSRHATAAVVYNNEIYVACGAGTRGGAQELNTQEKFSFSGSPPGGCVANEIVSFTLVKAGTAGDIDTLTDGMTINLATIGPFSIRANKCQNSGSVKFIVNGSTVRTESSAPYSINGDNSGSYIAWNPSVGSKTLTATPYTQGGGGGTAGISKTVTFTVIDEAGGTTDCHGDVGGTAFYDDCGVCSGGNTGHAANSDKDNCGVCFGNNSSCCITDADCNDNNICTTDQCSNGNCSHSAVFGCCQSAADCNDNDACTTDACTGNSCTHTGSGSGTPSYLKVVNPSASYRKMRVGYSSTGLYSPKYDVSAGGNNQLCITLKDVNGTTQWDKIKVKPQGASSPVVYLGTYVPANPGTNVFTVCIPLSIFTSNDFTKISFFELQCNNAAAFEIQIQKIEFTGGATPFLWFGDPKIDNFHDGTTNSANELITTTIAGQPCGSQKMESDEIRVAELPALKAYPNPFSNNLTVEFSAVYETKTQVEIIGLDGRIAGEIFNGTLQAGETQSRAFHSETLPDGMYFLRLTTGDGIVENRKLILLR